MNIRKEIFFILCLINLTDFTAWKQPCEDKDKCYCSNGGTCYNLDTLAKCICHCTKFFTGDHCEYMNPINKECQKLMRWKIMGLTIEMDVNCEYVEWILEPDDLVYKAANSVPQEIRKGLYKLKY